MRKECEINGLKWIHMTHPSRDDFAYLDGIFSFHPLVKESVVAPTLHPLVDSFDDHLFLILHFPIIYESKHANKVAEVDFLITKNILVTITYMEFKNLETLFDDFQKNEEVQKRLTHKHTGLLLHYIVDQLFQKLARGLEFMEKEITRIEDEIFKKGDRRRLVEDISHARRDILDFRRALKPQSGVLKLLIAEGEQFYGHSVGPYFADVLSTEERFENLVENQRETIEMLHHTNESLLSSRISNIMAVLTVFSAIVLPLNLIASIWGMNQQIMPLRDGRHDFWIVVGIMAVLLFVLVLFFKKKRWL